LKRASKSACTGPIRFILLVMTVVTADKEVYVLMVHKAGYQY